MVLKERPQEDEPTIELHDPETITVRRAQSAMFRAEASRVDELLAYADDQQGRIDAEVELRQEARQAARAQGQRCTNIETFDAAAEWSWVICCLAQALQTAENTVAADINDARFARDQLPACWNAFHHGHFGTRQLSRIVSAAEKLTEPQHISWLDQQAADYAASHRTGQLQAWLNKHVARLEPEQFSTRYAQNLRRRRVWVQDLEDEGLSQLCAILPSLTARRIAQRLDTVARSPAQPVPHNPEITETEHHELNSSAPENSGTRRPDDPQRPRRQGPTSSHTAATPISTDVWGTDAWGGKGTCVHGIVGGSGGPEDPQTGCADCDEAQRTAEEKKTQLREAGDEEAANQIFIDYGPADPLSPDFDPIYQPDGPHPDEPHSSAPDTYEADSAGSESHRFEMTDAGSRQTQSHQAQYSQTQCHPAEPPVSIDGGDQRTLGQREADMLAAWLLNGDTDAGIPIDAHIGVLIPAESLTAQNPETAAPGFTRDRRTPISAAAIRGIAQDPHSTTRWHEIHLGPTRNSPADPPDHRTDPPDYRTHPRAPGADPPSHQPDGPGLGPGPGARAPAGTGAGAPAGAGAGEESLDVLTHIYRGRFVPAILREAISFRDGVCTADGCMVPAENCDMDHRTPWPTGETTGTNCQPLCRRHHRLKTHSRPITPG